MRKKHRFYIVAFNRDRDFYQQPLALEEGDLLAALVTDLYLPDVLSGSGIARRLGLAHRHCAGIPSAKVHWSGAALWLQMVGLRRARGAQERSKIFHSLDSALSRQAGRLAAATGSGLFPYSGYALEAFSMAEHRATTKLLFVYHPQGDHVRRILEADVAAHPEVAQSHQAHLDEIALNEGDRVREEISMADAVACASEFTAASVRAVRGAPALVSAVPYGCFAVPVGAQLRPGPPQGSKRQVLYVGQGTQRKGLHHLVKVWGRGLQRFADLTLVVNNMDPGIAALLRALPEPPRVLSGLSCEELAAEFARADVFLLPSLVEGFGLVYLEALAAGCHVIGTRNTGLPDLNAPEQVATVFEAGDLDALQRALETTIRSAAAGELDRGAIQAFARTRTWDTFRRGIREFVHDAEQAGTAPIA